MLMTWAWSWAPRRRSLAAAALAIAAIVGVPMAAFFEAQAQAQPAAVGERAWLGLAMEKDAAKGTGVRVSHVVRGSPADRAGLREGDRVVRVGTTSVLHAADVVRTVAQHAVGETLEIGYLRTGAAEQSARALLARFPSTDDMMRMDLVGAFAPEWKHVQGVSGTVPSSLAALRGHVVVLDFWATWCGPCRIVMPKLSALQQRYGAQGLRVVGLSTEDADDVAAFAQHMSVAYPIAVDTQSETTRDYGVSSLPTLVVVDKRGVVRDVSIGYDPSEDTQLEATLRALLGEATPTD
ncbi:MAG TPA: redoxin domain-containing protein [Polyangiaceae bacterium]|nr:redoxin domain-containing protein [Polyangiaceae bacterium]